MYGDPNGLLQVADHPLHDVIMLTWSDGRDGHAHCIHVSCKRRDPSFIVAGEAIDLDTAGSDGEEHFAGSQSGASRMVGNGMYQSSSSAPNGHLFIQ